MRVVIDDVFCGLVTTTSDTNSFDDDGISYERTEVDKENEHLLRCDYDRVGESSTPDHDRDFAVRCSEYSGLACQVDHLILSLSHTDEDDGEGYDTQVRLVQGNTGFSSSGFVEVYLHDSYGPVCNMGAHDADSACRQLGYTNAVSFGSDESY